jgi:hypothetical protein
MVGGHNYENLYVPVLTPSLPTFATSPSSDLTLPKKRKFQPTLQPPSSSTDTAASTELGKLIVRDRNFMSTNSFLELVRTRQGRGDITSLSRVQHPARHLLQHLSKSGAPVVLKTPPWSPGQLQAAIQRGPHKSAYEYQQFLVEEMTDMIKKAFWIVLPFSEAQKLQNLRISPIGVVPQRDRRPRPIVDYSFSGLNTDTVSLAPPEAMQFGRTLERLITQVVRADPRFGPVQFIKIDIADGFYRVWVRAEDVPKLGVAFPSLDAKQPLVAFPLVLPMGWTESPPYFCTVTETITDLANERILKWRPAPTHRLEPSANTRPPPLNNRPPSNTTSHHTQLPTHRDPMLPSNSRQLGIVDIFVDDFVAAAQGSARRRNHIRRILLNAIDDVLRPLDSADSASRREPISVKKLRQGDASWSTVKTVLGWIIDTVAMTLTLPSHRIERLAELLASIPPAQKRLSLDKWYRLLGELRSMSIALPGARGLFSHLQAALHTRTDGRLRLSKGFHAALDDFRWLHQDIANRPTRLQELVPTTPTITGTHDASGTGAGGVWFPSTTAVPRPVRVSYINRHGRLQRTRLTKQHPILWRHHFDSSIQNKLITRENPGGSFGISELELAGSAIHADVGAQCFDLRERTAKSSTDNLATMYWTRKGSTTTTTATAPLLRLQAIHQRFHRYVPLKDYVPGSLNPMADDSSRLFHLTDAQLLHHFNTHYPQTLSWRLYHPTLPILSAVTSALHNKTSTPELFLLDPLPPPTTGQSGIPSAKNSEWIQLYKSSKIPSPSSKSLLDDTAPATLPRAESRSALEQWKTPYAVLARRRRHWGPRILASRPMAR